MNVGDIVIVKSEKQCNMPNGIHNDNAIVVIVDYLKYENEATGLIVENILGNHYIIVEYVIQTVTCYCRILKSHIISTIYSNDPIIENMYPLLKLLNTLKNE